ncbi:MAG: preprotein translocase subunit SecY [Fimbriimonadaceae bacterium]|jgi:preprotein translocase subunit SecY|nr:preprotein translocase subunit SecY [Fimbriimonadaceae bacterium]
MGALGGGVGGYGGGSKGDKALQLPVSETLRLAWADDDLRSRILFVLGMFAVFCLGAHVPVPIPGVTASELFESLKGNIMFQFIDTLGGGALKRVSIFALGMNPYITSSIILQILTTAIPSWKQELQEGGEYARRQQNQRTRLLSIALCIFQSLGLIQMISSASPQAAGAFTPAVTAMVVVFWTAGAMFMLWLGEQISEKGIGNGVSLMIFAGIVFSMPQQIATVKQELELGQVKWWGVIVVLIAFVATTWLIVYFTTAQRRIPVQHMRRMVGTRVMQGGSTSYLPLSVNTAGVIPIIFAITLLYMPSQFAQFFPQNSTMHNILETIGKFMMPDFQVANAYMYRPIIACFIYTALIFFFTYFYTAIQYNVEDIANNLKRAGSFIPGVRPGKQTKDFLDGVISRITVVGAAFLAAVALLQFVIPGLTGLHRVNVIGGTTLLIMVSVALETMRQIEANLLMKQYGS